MKLEIAQEGFTGGQMSPSLFGRADSEDKNPYPESISYVHIPSQYENACQTIQNFLVKKEGSLISCPGTEFINDAKNSGGADRGDNLGIDDNTLLLLKGEGADESQVFIDSSPYERTVEKLNNEPEIDTEQKKFGASSISFPRTGLSSGIGETLIITNDGGLDVPKTLECWFRVSSLTQASSSAELYSRGVNSVGTTDGWAFGIFRVSTTQVQLVYNVRNVGGGQLIATVDFSVDTWHHVALTVDGTAVKMFLDGTTVLNGTALRGRPTGGEIDVTIQSRFHGESPNSWIDEYRLHNDVVYTGDFTPPTAPFSNASDERARLIDFVFSRTDSYIIEMGVGYFRFYTNGGVVEA